MYHGIIVDKSLADPAVKEELKIIGQGKSESNNWVLFKVEVAPERLEEVIRKLQG